MKHDTYNFKVHYINSYAKISCKFITNTNETITISGNTVEQIFLQCVNRFPEGIRTKGLIFLCENQIEAKKNFCALISMGLQTGYFKESDFDVTANEEEGDSYQ
jgi:hypothetical protein